MLLVLLRCISRSLALLIHQVIAASLSYSLVQGVAQSVLGSAAPVAFVPPQLRPRRRRRLVEALVPPRLCPRRHWLGRGITGRVLGRWFQSGCPMYG